MTRRARRGDEYGSQEVGRLRSEAGKEGGEEALARGEGPEGEGREEVSGAGPAAREARRSPSRQAGFASRFFSHSVASLVPA